MSYHSGWDAVFLLEVDNYGIEFAVLAELDRIVDIGTCADVQSLYFEMLGSLNVSFGDLGKGTPVTVGKLGCGKLLCVIDDRLGISCALGGGVDKYWNAYAGFLAINDLDYLGDTKSDQYDCEDRGKRKQDIKQLSELDHLRAVLILNSYIILIII